MDWKPFRMALYGSLLGFLVGVGVTYHYYDKKASEARIEALEAIDELHEENLAIEAKYKKESEEYEKTIRSLRADVASGKLQLSAKAKTITVSESGEKRCELDPEVSERLISITEDGDKAIRELNMCIDKYNAARDKYGYEEVEAR